MIPAATVIHAEPPHPCAGCRHLAQERSKTIGYDRNHPRRWCLLHVTPLARCRLYEHPPTGNPSHLSSLMTR